MKIIEVESCMKANTRNGICPYIRVTNMPGEFSCMYDYRFANTTELFTSCRLKDKPKEKEE